MTLNNSNIQLAGKNIVIVEDDLPSIMYYKALLKNVGGEAKIFRTGKEFVDYITQEKNIIDFVFIDYFIPLINGIDCVKIFRKERKSTPVIMLTTYCSEQIKTESYIAGCNEFVLKPIYPEKILFLLDKYLNSEIPVFKQ
jgi:CheY-like chemotaxis protein